MNLEAENETLVIGFIIQVFYHCVTGVKFGDLMRSIFAKNRAGLSDSKIFYKNSQIWPSLADHFLVVGVNGSYFK